MSQRNRYLVFAFLFGVFPLQILCADTAVVLKPINPGSLQAAVAAAAKNMAIPGVFVLLRTPQGEFEVSYGTSKRNTSMPPARKTHFRIASVTKTMTAAVIVQQAQEGKLSFSDSIAKFLPEVPNGEHITIADLLRMRSGLYNYTESPILSASLDNHPNKAWTTREILAIAFSQPPYFKPDSAYYYSNTNYALLGLVAEKLDKKPLARIFKERLFEPFGMKNTLLPERTSNTLPAPFAHGYQYGSASYALVDKSYPQELQVAAKNGTLQPIDYTLLNPSYALAAGGVISTAHDLDIWVNALVGGKVFNADYQRSWLDSLLAEDKNKPDGQQYGYGIVKLSFGPNRIYYHGGECPGYNTFMGYDPANKVTLIVWANQDISLDGQLTANAIMVTMLEQIYVASPFAKPE